MRITDDPLRDFDAWDREREAELSRLPKCEKCNNPIQDDYYYDIEGDILCGDCVDDLYKLPVDIYYD